MSTFCINGKLADNKGLTNLRNPLSWLLTFSVVSFNKIPLFSKELITFIISFIALFHFISALPELLLDANFFLSSFIPL